MIDMKLLLLIFFLSFNLNAIGLQFDSPEKTKRYYTLIDQIRCPVCQGQSISGSNAPLAKDLRQQVAKMLIEGKSDNEIKDFMIARYGDFVSFAPPVNQQTYILWFAPFIMVVLALVLLFRNIKQRRLTEVIDTNEAEKYL